MNRSFKDLGTVHNRATADISLIDVENRKIPFIVISDDNSGLRYDWYKDEVYEERLEVSGATFDTLKTFFKDHRMSVDTAIGRVENIRIENNQLKCDVVFGTDTESDVIFSKFREGILTDVSIGYVIQEIQETKRKDEPTEILVTKFDIRELSAVWKSFDKKATIGRSEEENLNEEVGNDDEENRLLKEKRNRQIKLLEMA